MRAPIEPGVGVDTVLQGDLAAALLDEAAVLEKAHELLGKEGIAAGPLKNQRLQVRWQTLCAQSGPASSAVSSPERGPRARGLAVATKPAPAPVSSSTSGRAVASTSSGAGAGLLGEEVEEGEQRLVGPVQVLDDHDGGAGAGEALEEDCPSREVLLP